MALLVSSAGVSSQAALPPYAVSGASATYSEFGGFVAFFGGVYGNVTFAVESVSSNGSMVINVQANVSQSGEAPPVFMNSNYTDSAFAPSQFPALPPANLSSAKLSFENSSCAFVKNSVIDAPAGEFNATEFVGTSQGGNVTYYWFDRPTGLLVEVSRAGATLELLRSNIAAPVGTESQLELYLPYVLIIAGLWIGGVILFLYLVRRRPGLDGASSSASPSRSRRATLRRTAGAAPPPL